MKRLVTISALALASTVVLAAPKHHSKHHSKLFFKNNNEKVSYILGYKTAISLMQSPVKLDANKFNLGFSAALHKLKPALSNAEMAQAMQAFKTQVVAILKKKAQGLAERNLKAGIAFLKLNAKKKGVKTLASGVQYRVLKAGSGARPKKTDSVTVNYEGRLINNKIFDSSYARKQPATFKLNQVIPGWTDALSHMREGATWRIYIPANLAYGVSAPASIGPNQVLVFKVNLIKVK